MHLAAPGVCKLRLWLCACVYTRVQRLPSLRAGAALLVVKLAWHRSWLQECARLFIVERIVC